VASALVNTTQQVGSSLGTALLNTIAASAAATFLADHAHTRAEARTAVVHGYTTAFTVSALLLLLAAGASAGLIRASRHDVPGEQIEPAHTPEPGPGVEAEFESADRDRWEPGVPAVG
jgi:hypothetical protein